MRDQARTNSRLRRLLASTVVVLVLALIAGGLALWQRNRADQQATQARASSVSAEVDRIVAEMPALLPRDRALGALLAVQAERLRPDPTTRGALLAALTREPAWRFTVYGGRSGYRSLGVYPDGKRVAAMGPDGVDIWDFDTRRRIGSFSVPAATSVAVSRDGGLIAVGTANGTVAFRDATTLRPEGQVLHVGEPVSDLAFAPDRRWLAIAMQPPTAASGPLAASALFWDGGARSAAPMPPSVEDRGTSAVAFSPDGRLLATGDRFGNIVIRDRDGNPIGPPLAAGGIAYSMAFTYDDTRLGVGLGGPGNAVVFDTRTHQMSPGPATGGETVVAFSPDSSSLVVSDNLAGSVAVQDTRTGRMIGAPIVTQHGYARVAFLPGIGLVLSGYDGTLSVWDPDGPSTIARVIPGSPSAGGLYSPGGSILATSSNDDTVTLYMTRDLHVAATLTIAGPGERDRFTGPTPAAFSPDGATVAIGDRFGDVQLFDTRFHHPLGPPRTVGRGNPPVELSFSPDGRHLVMTSVYVGLPAHVLTLATGQIQALEPPAQSSFLIATFSPDGRRLVVTGQGGATVFPVARDGVGPGRFLKSIGASALSAAFSPDGHVMAVGSENGTIQLLDAKSMRPRGGPVTLSQGPASIAFSPDSRLLVAQGADATNRLFDVGRRSPIGEAFPGNDIGYGISGFASDSRTVALPGPAGTTLWDLNDAHWRARACALAGRQLTSAEWARYLASVGAYRPTCA